MKHTVAEIKKTMPVGKNPFKKLKKYELAKINPH